MNKELTNEDIIKIYNILEKKIIFSSYPSTSQYSENIGEYCAIRQFFKDNPDATSCCLYCSCKLCNPIF